MVATVTEHPVKKKLRNDILPYLITAKHLNKQWFCRTYTLFGYTTDTLVALTTLGLIPAVITNIFGTNPNNTEAKFSDLAALLPEQFHYFYYVLLVVVLAWLFLRVAFTREDGQKRAVLAKSCSLTMRQAEARLPHLLGNADPMPGITELYDNSIYPIVDRNIQENAWPWNPFAPNINDEVEKHLAELCGKYEPTWLPIDKLPINNPIGARTNPSIGGQNDR